MKDEKKSHRNLTRRRQIDEIRICLSAGAHTSSLKQNRTDLRMRGGGAGRTRMIRCGTPTKAGEKALRLRARHYFK